MGEMASSKENVMEDKVALLGTQKCANFGNVIHKTADKAEHANICMTILNPWN